MNANLQSLKRKSDELPQSHKTGGNKYGYLKDIHTKHKIKRQKLSSEHLDGKRWHYVKSIKLFTMAKIVFFFSISEANDECPLELVVQDVVPKEEQEIQYELLDVEDEKFYRGK